MHTRCDRVLKISKDRESNAISLLQCASRTNSHQANQPSQIRLGRPSCIKLYKSRQMRVILNLCAINLNKGVTASGGELLFFIESFLFIQYKIGQFSSKHIPNMISLMISMINDHHLSSNISETFKNAPVDNSPIKTTTLPRHTFLVVLTWASMSHENATLFETWSCVYFRCPDITATDLQSSPSLISDTVHHNSLHISQYTGTFWQHTHPGNYSRGT